MGSLRLLTPDDVTQPRIRECLERLLSLTFFTLREHDLLADLPDDFEIVSERMDPEVPEAFYFVSQSLRRVINYAYDCPCGPNPTHSPDQCPSPKLSTLPFSPYLTPPVISYLYCNLFFFLRVGEDARNALLEALGLIPHAHHRIAPTL
jgi:hypothetical protein